ncbi:condensation domain-containing protein [Microbulbifer taiwanensis]|uniref:condensation domain-containing protein n=1 Tax=Microbulbifer taiwanensis TaxID=986746 RepID=UPI0036186220
MEAAIENLSHSSPLGPEQRARLACWGGEARAERAILVMEIELEAGLPAARLRSAVEQAVREHRILAATLCRQPGFRGLRLRAGASAPLHWCEVGSLQAARARAVEPLDLDGGQLLRALFAAEEGGGARLLLAVSALVADSGSLAALAAQIGECLDGADRGDSRARFQYGQYLQWRAELEADADAPAGRDYWARRLRDLDALAAPRLVYRRDCPPAGTYLHLRGQLDAAAMARIHQQAERAGTTAEVLLQTAWWLLLARLSGNFRFTAGWLHDCRQDYELMQGAVGVFEKLLPVSVAGGEEESFAQWLARAATMAAAHIEAQEYCPLEPTETGGHNAVGFAYREAPSRAGSEWGQSGLRSVALPGAAPGFELALELEVTAEGAGLCLCADSALYPQAAIEHLLEQYITQLLGALERPHSAVADLPWMGEAELRRRGPGWCGAELDLGPRSIGGHIARWARQTPDAPAVACGDLCLSYRELDARASRLAHWMRARGVTPGALVALELPRSPDLVAAMLATWRVGAAYLPLDPGWPQAAVSRCWPMPSPPWWWRRRRCTSTPFRTGPWVTGRNRRTRPMCSTPPVPPGAPRAWRSASGNC